MGWFGSLSLLFKIIIVFGVLIAVAVLVGLVKVLYDWRRLKKLTRKAELKAAGAREERVELDTRQLDEGDLFGVRALQSGHGGGVAHSRPTSVAGSVLSQGSGDGNHLSSTLVATTPASSVTALQPSQLAHNAMSTDDIRRSETLSAQHSLPTSPRFLPSERDSSGRINHNLAINMSQGVPASPVSPSRPPAAHSLCESRSPSPAFPFPRMPRDDDFANQPALRPGMPLDARRSSSRTVPTSENHESDIKSQSGSIISRSTSAKSNLKRTSLSNHRVRSYQPDYVQFPARPAGAVQADRPLSNGSDHPLRTSSLPRVASKYPPVENQAPVLRPPRVDSAISDWGPAIFNEIDQSLADSKTMSTHGPLPNQGYSNHGRHPSSSERNVYHHGPPLDQSYTEHTHAPHCQRYRPASGHISPVRDRQSHILSPSPHQPYSHTLPDALINPVYFHRRDLSSNEKNNYHTSKLSASSSIYSSPNYVRNVTANVSVDSKSLSHTTDTLPSSASSEVDDQHSNSHILFKGTRRMSDASSLQPVSVSESTGGGSHRNTRELGDFYDSYWRQSTLSTSTLAGRGGDFGKQTLFNLSNSKGVGEMGMDSRRPGQMDLKVATIVEVPSPLPSPMPGTAL